jgi:hypothetical protein
MTYWTPGRSPSRPSVDAGKYGMRSGFALTAFQHFTNPILVVVGVDQAVAMGFAILTNGEFGFLVKHPTESGVLEYVPSEGVTWPPVLATRSIADGSGELGSGPTTHQPNRAERRHGN